MASVTARGDKFLAQVRIKQGGVLIFSESKVFDTRPQAMHLSCWLNGLGLTRRMPKLAAGNQENDAL